MYTEKDNTGKIIIQNMTVDDVSILREAINVYISTVPLADRTDSERALILLNKELEQLTK